MIDTNEELDGNITIETNLTGELTRGTGGEPTDVQINGTSITSNGVANLRTEGTYNAETNKIATMSDVGMNKIPANSTVDLFSLEDGIYEVEGYCVVTVNGEPYFLFDKNHSLLSITNGTDNGMKNISYWYQKYNAYINDENTQNIDQFIFGYGIITEDGEWYTAPSGEEIPLEYIVEMAFNAQNSIAEQYRRKTYSKGDLVTHEGQLYICKQDISVAEDWNMSHWDSTNVAEQLGTIKNEIGDVETLLGGI